MDDDVAVVEVAASVQRAQHRHHRGDAAAADEEQQPLRGRLGQREVAGRREQFPVTGYNLRTGVASRCRYGVDPKAADLAMVLS